MRNTSSDKHYFHQSTFIHWDFARTMSSSETTLFFSFVDWSDRFSIDFSQEKHSFLVQAARFNTNHFLVSTSVSVSEKFHNKCLVSWSCWQHFSVSEKLRWYCLCNFLVVGLQWIILGFAWDVLWSYLRVFQHSFIRSLPHPQQAANFREGNAIMKELQKFCVGCFFLKKKKLHWMTVLMFWI